MFLDISFNFFKFIDNIISYISTLLSFIVNICDIIVKLSYTFFTNMPSWISSGLLMVFTLSFIILIIKIVR